MKTSDEILCGLPRGENAELRVSLSEFKGKRTAYIRQWNRAHGSELWLPDAKRGLSIRPAEIEPVAAALLQARRLLSEELAEAAP